MKMDHLLALHDPKVHVAVFVVDLDHHHAQGLDHPLRVGQGHFLEVPVIHVPGPFQGQDQEHLKVEADRGQNPDLGQDLEADLLGQGKYYNNALTRRLI